MGIYCDTRHSSLSVNPLQRVTFTACGGIFSWKPLWLAQLIHESIFGKHLLNEMLQSAHLTAELTKGCTGWGQKLLFVVPDLCPMEMWVSDRHMAQFPWSTSQQSAVLGLLEPGVVSSCLTALDGFLSSCLLLPLACTYAEEQPQKAVVVSCYTPARRNRK